LVDPSLWSAVAADEDPFTDRPDSVDCPSSSWGVEVSESGETALELDTGVCDYASFSQDSLARVQAGDRVFVNWTHSDLTAEEPSQAHVAIWLGEVVLWDSVEPIPSTADETRYDLPVEIDVPVGTPVWIHVHNHGDNKWTFGEMWTESGEGS
jgi:hypothetical protein